jgi:PAS domain S-box-containing protein
MVKKLAENNPQNQTASLEKVLAKTAALSTLPLNQILEKIVENAHDLIGTESSSILLIGNPTQVARFPSSKERNSGPRRNGLTAHVARSGKPIVIEDAQGDRQVKPSTKNRGIKSILGVPLKVWIEHENISEIRTIGALFVNSIEGRQFSDRDTELLQSLAAQAAIVIESSRRAQALETLNQISLEISHYSQIPELVKYILLQAVELVQAKGGRLCLLDESGEQVKWGVMSNSPDHLIPIKMEVKGGVFERAIKNRKPFTKSNYQKWWGRRKEFDKYGFTAVAGTPIIWQDKIWGALLVHHDMEGRVFSEEDLKLLAHLGNLVAIALENIRRMNDLERLMESAFDSIIALDESGNIIKFNRQAERILGYKAKEVLGQSVRDLYYDLKDARRVRRLLLENKDGRVTGLDTFLKSKKGERIPIRLSASLLFDYEGKRAGNVGFFRDRREYEASQVVISSLNKNEILSSITEQAWKLTGASQSSHLALTFDNRLEFIAAYPPEHLSKLQQAIRYIDLEQNKPIGVMGRAAKSGKAQLVGNVHEDPDYIPYDPETCSELAVPIITQGKVIGVIDVEQSTCEAFSLQDQQTLEALAAYASIAIENARLYDQSKLQSKRLKAVAHISRKAAARLEVRPLLRTACRLLEQDLQDEKYAIASIRLYDEENDILVFDPSWHESFHSRIDVENEEEPRRTQRLDEGICGWVATHKEPLNIGDIDNFTGYLRLITSTRAELCVPICYGKDRKLIGVLDVQSPVVNAFDKNDEEILKILADQLAVAIHNARLYEPLQRLSQHRNAIYEATKIVSAGVAVKQKELLERILEQTVKLIKLAKADTAILGAIQLVDEANNELYLAIVYPEKSLKEWRDRLGEKRSLDRRKNKIGITGRTVEEREPQRVADVRLDPDYVLLDPSTRSELDVPLLEGDKVLGVLSLESNQVAAFDEADQQTLLSLAELAVIAIQYVRQYEELERTQKILTARTTVARMGMVNANLQHTVRINAAVIKGEVENLRFHTSQEYLDRINKRLDKIQREAQKILDKPIAPPLSDTEAVESVLVNGLLRERLKQLWENEPYKSIQLIMDLKLDRGITIWANPEWLRELVDMLVDNAVIALADVSTPVLRISTRTASRNAEIGFADNGKGILPPILSKLFSEPIKETNGSGRGLLLAQLIANTYGGEIRVESTGPAGTSMIVSLPIEMKTVE